MGRQVLTGTLGSGGIWYSGCFPGLIDGTARRNFWLESQPVNLGSVWRRSTATGRRDQLARQLSRLIRLRARMPLEAKPANQTDCHLSRTVKPGGGIGICSEQQRPQSSCWHCVGPVRVFGLNQTRPQVFFTRSDSAVDRSRSWRLLFPSPEETAELGLAQLGMASGEQRNLCCVT